MALLTASAGTIRPGSVGAWVQALRPQTLPAAVSPVLVGGALAYSRSAFHLRTFLAALLVAGLLQGAVNLANDYFDYVNEVDEHREGGFERVCEAGLLDPVQVRRAMIGLIVLSFLPGLYLVYYGGVPALLVGAASLVALIGYSGGPFPYGSWGLGDLMVLTFFGFVATAGTEAVQVLARRGSHFLTYLPPSVVRLETLLAGLVPGGSSTAILVVNNLRDRRSDRKAGKWTLAVLLGRAGSLIEYGLLLATSHAVPLLFYLRFDHGPSILLALLTLPVAAWLCRELARAREAERYNQLLESTGRLLFANSTLFVVGVMLSA